VLVLKSREIGLHTVRLVKVSYIGINDYIKLSAKLGTKHEQLNRKSGVGNLSCVPLDGKHC